MDLLDRATLTFYDLRGDYSRERKDQLLGSLDRKYATGDVVQIQFVRRELEGAKRGLILQTTGFYTSKIPQRSPAKK